MILFDRKKALNQIMGPHPDHKAGGGEVETYEQAHAIAEEIIGAVHAKDPKAYAKASHAMFLHWDNLPHSEYDETHEAE